MCVCLENDVSFLCDFVSDAGYVDLEDDDVLSFG